MTLLQNIPFLNTLNSIQLLWLLWIVTFLIFLILSMVLSYQWRHYGVQNSNLRFGEFIYYIIAIIILGFSALAILIYNAHF